MNVKHKNADGIRKTVVQNVKTVKWPQEADPSARKSGLVSRPRKSKSGSGCFSVLHTVNISFIVCFINYII